MHYIYITSSVSSDVQSCICVANENRFACVFIARLVLYSRAVV